MRQQGLRRRRPTWTTPISNGQGRGPDGQDQGPCRSTVVGVHRAVRADGSENGGSDDCHVTSPTTVAGQIAMAGSIIPPSPFCHAEDTVTGMAESGDRLRAALYEVFGSRRRLLCRHQHDRDAGHRWTSMINILVYASSAGIAAIILGGGRHRHYEYHAGLRHRAAPGRSASANALGAKTPPHHAAVHHRGGYHQRPGRPAWALPLGYGLSAVATQLITIGLGENLSVVPTMNSILVAFGISAGIGVLFGYLPARKAARLNPIDALRHD